MAVLAMQKVNIYATKNERKNILELLQRRNEVEILTSKIEKDNVFWNMDISQNKSTFENSQKSIIQAVSILDSLVKPESSAFAMFEGRESISLQEYKDVEKSAEKNIKKAQRIVLLSKKIAEQKADIVKNNASIEALEPWLDLDVSMRIKETLNTMVFLGTLPGDFSEEDILTSVAKNAKNSDSLHVELLSHMTQQTCFFAVCHKRQCGEIEMALRAMGMSYPVAPSKVPPKERVEILKSRNEKANLEIKEAQTEIITFKDERKALLYTADYLSMREEKYENLSKLILSNKTFTIKGYVTKEDSQNLKNVLENNYTCYVEFEDISAKEDAPVKLKNNGFAAPIEGVVESFSLPNKKEFDPSTITAIFYYFLFGLMLSDLAYGLLMVIGCSVVLAKFKNMEQGLKNSIKMFLYCGISTAFWGLMFGSFFGDVIEVVGETFFNASWSTPCLWYQPINEPMRLLMFSMLLGIIHLFTGLALKFYMYAKQGKILDGIYDVIFWYFLVGGAIVYFMSMEMFLDISGLGWTLPVSVGNVGAVLAVIGAIGIIFTAGRESKKPVIRIMKGLYGLYGATSYLSDILSYSRLLALGLATGVIASVFNQMGAMGGQGVVGVILFIVVFLLGHSLNIGLNLLGAYVHSNRLEFVEFFGKFYEGGGRKFVPFGTNTKHFKITEEK
ncbi:MAG: V-type ATP synthase subunit I [Clostridia bacterium]